MPECLLFYSSDVFNILCGELCGKDPKRFTTKERRYAHLRDVIAANPDCAGLYPRQMGGFLKTNYKDFKDLWLQHRKKTLGKPF